MDSSRVRNGRIANVTRSTTPRLAVPAEDLPSDNGLTFKKRIEDLGGRTARRGHASDNRSSGSTESGDEGLSEDDFDDLTEDESEEELYTDCVALPGSEGPLVVQDVFAVTSALNCEENPPLHDREKLHRFHGTFSHLQDANRAAQHYSQIVSINMNRKQYKETLDGEGAFHAYTKGDCNERLHVDVENMQHTVRQIKDTVTSSQDYPRKPRYSYLVRGDQYRDNRSDQERRNLVFAEILGEFVHLAAANRFAKENMRAEADERALDIYREKYPNGMYEASARFECEYGYDISVQAKQI